jgi:hypothetical protein
MRERLVIVLVAAAIGIIVTTLIFFLYQQTKSIPSKSTNISAVNEPAPTPANSQYLTIDQPQDESVSDRRSIQIKGRTNPGSTIIVTTNQEDSVAKPTADGNFAVTVTIDAGSNMIVTRSIAANGEEAQDIRVITFTTEEF